MKYKKWIVVIGLFLSSSLTLASNAAEESLSPRDMVDKILIPDLLNGPPNIINGANYGYYNAPHNGYTPVDTLSLMSSYMLHKNQSVVFGKDKVKIGGISTNGYQIYLCNEKAGGKGWLLSTAKSEHCITIEKRNVSRVILSNPSKPLTQIEDINRSYKEKGLNNSVGLYLVEEYKFTTYKKDSNGFVYPDSVRLVSLPDRYGKNENDRVNMTFEILLGFYLDSISFQNDYKKSAQRSLETFEELSKEPESYCSKFSPEKQQYFKEFISSLKGYASGLWVMRAGLFHKLESENEIQNAVVCLANIVELDHIHFDESLVLSNDF